MSNLFSTYKLGSLELKNRVVMAPMTRSMSPGNIANDDVKEYYRSRAEGGVGLIITEGTCIDHIAANGYPNVPAMHGEDALAGWQNVIKAVQAEGCKIAPQLWHVGGIRKPGTQPGGDTPGYSPSGMAFPGKITGHAMTQQDIDEVVASFVQGAIDAERTGFDAVELHGAHGYLIDQFFWPGTNQRSDNYGGSLENRMRFACDIVAGIREKVAPDFPIIFRFSQWKQQDYSARLAETPAELDKFLSRLVDAGVNIFHCSQRRFWEPEFEGSELNLAGWTKKLSGKSAITVGSVSLSADFLPENGDTAFKDSDIAGLDTLNEMLGRDEFDLVAVGRALIANPDWANRIRADELDQLIAFHKSMLMSLNPL